MPQVLDEHGGDADVQLQDIEPSTESVPAHDNTDSFSVTFGNQKNDAVSTESSHAVTEESHSHMPAVDRMKICSLISTVSDANSEKYPLTDVCNVIPVTETMDTSVTSDQLLTGKSHSRAPKTKTVECPIISSFSYSSHHNKLSTQSTSKLLTPAYSHREGKYGISLRSGFAENTEKTASYLCSSSHRSVGSDDISAVGISSDTAVSASGSATARSTAASDTQSISHSIDKQATGSYVTLGSMIGASVHQTAAPDSKIVRPNLVAGQQSRVRFEGNQLCFEYSFYCNLPMYCMLKSYTDSEL